jgi:predicted transcriptional regulator
MRPATKTRLKAIAEHENRSEWRVVEDSIASYLEHMTPKDRRAVEAIVRRVATERD